MTLLLLIAVLASCGKERTDLTEFGENAGIIGTWVQEGYEADMTLLKRAEALSDTTYGFSVKDDGTFIERKNAGWCATPPVTYDNFEGTWEAVSDSLLNITVGYWGGIMTYQIRIVSLDANSLKIRYLYAMERAGAR